MIATEKKYKVPPPASVAYVHMFSAFIVFWGQERSFIVLLRWWQEFYLWCFQYFKNAAQKVRRV